MTGRAPSPPDLPASNRLFRQLVALAFPVIAENVLHIFVGFNDTHLAGYLKSEPAAATAAIGAVTYVLWLMGLIAAAFGVGSTAIIARAAGARHRSLANSVCGQSIGAAALAGTVMAVLIYALAKPLSDVTGLSGAAYAFTLYYVRILSLCLPFLLVMLTANACLRGAGDTVTPAVAMIVVDVVNMLLSFALTRGWWGLPAMGFRGIAIGTVVAYVVGGVLQVAVLLHGRKMLRLHLHRLRPHWLTLKRVLRIGLPGGMEGVITWGAQFEIIRIINRLDATNVLASAHIISVRVEALSYMLGMGIATAAATMVGQSLGMKDPARARRSAYLAYAAGAAIMGFMGVIFIFLGRTLASFFTADPHTAALAGHCLFVTAFAQLGFAASLIFSGALRGAGDTLAVMIVNLASTLGLRLIGVLVVTSIFHGGLVAIWYILAIELTIRGLLMYLRFLHGGWRHVNV